MRNILASIFVLFLWSQLAHSAISPGASALKGSDVLTGKAISTSLEGHKGLVVVFLSAVCPCSNSHIQELTALSKAYPDFIFLGVHSNSDEKKDQTQTYFQNAKLPFPVIQDNGAKIADEFKAYKTPHAFVMKANGEIAYEGGVSSSHDFANADRKFLREALEDLDKNRPVKTPEGRTLGCVISRGEKYVW